jgi:GTP cyclohydrolase IA
MKKISNATEMTQACTPLIPHLARGIFLEIGEDPLREGLVRTPERFTKAMQDLTSGYSQTVESVVGEGIFESESSGLICVKDIEFYSLCEHHMLPFWGKASIAYLPNQKILGLSKLARILDVFAKRLQVQERLTKEVAESIFKLIDAKAVAVVIEAQHMCMMMRGVGKQSSFTSTEYSVGFENISEDEKDRMWKQFKN